MASDGLRTIGLGYKDILPAGKKTAVNEEEFTGSIDWENEESIRENMTTIAICGIQDPVRPEVGHIASKKQIQ